MQPFDVIISSGGVFMLYSENVKILEMIKRSNWVPTTKETLETLLNNTEVGFSINDYFNDIKYWMQKVFTALDTDKHSYVIINKSSIIGIAESLLEFYRNLLKYIINNYPKDEFDGYISTERSKRKELSELLKRQQTQYKNKEEEIVIQKDVMQPKEALEFLEDELSCYLRSYYDDNEEEDNSFFYDILERLKPGICLRWRLDHKIHNRYLSNFHYTELQDLDSFRIKATCLKIRLRNDMTQDDITKLYTSWLNFFFNFFDYVDSLERSIVALHRDSWEGKVFNPAKLTEMGDFQPNKIFKIEEPQNVLISFCNNPRTYLYSSQKMVSTSLHNTMLLVAGRQRPFQRRTFGFMYDFSPEEIVGMSPSDAEASEKKFEHIGAVFKYALQGTPISSLVKRFHISPVDFEPLFDFKKFENKTKYYNEILLKEGNEPYGIFVFKQALERSHITVLSTCIYQDLPLFICNEDGSMIYVPVSDIMDILDGEISLNYYLNKICNQL